MSGFAQQNLSKWINPYRTMLGERLCQTVREESSWARLKNPDGFKHGGGVRVWRILMNDNFMVMIVVMYKF